MQHIVNSLVNGEREPSDEPRDVSNVLQRLQGSGAISYKNAAVMTNT